MILCRKYTYPLRNVFGLWVLVLALSSAVLGQESPSERLKALGVELPQASAPVANYVPAVRSGSLVYLAGSIPFDPDGKFIKGRLGDNFTVDQGYEAARNTGVRLLAALLGEIGDLDKVVRVVKVEGMVNATPDFEKHSLVINGCSDLLVEVFGDAGRHARTAVGMSSLPFGAPCEIAMIVEVED